VRAYVDDAGIFVWVEDARVVGFSAADPRNGNIVALFVEEGYERRGIGRALFERACDVLVTASCPRLWLTTWPGTRAERFYRAAGWRVVGEDDGNLVFERTARPAVALAPRAKPPTLNPRYLPAPLRIMTMV
jgi:GNAT superfamily N-acetyltransferase